MRKTSTLISRRKVSRTALARKAGARTKVSKIGGRPAATPDIVFVLAPPRSFTSITCAMLGQHPQLYGVPELRLFAAETIEKWINLCSEATYPMASGTLRTISQLIFGEQTERAVQMAWGWLRERPQWTTKMLVEALAEVVRPRIIIDKSPNVVYWPEFLHRMYRMFPNARFIHLLRHPRGHGESVIKLMRHIEKRRGE